MSGRAGNFGLGLAVLAAIVAGILIWSGDLSREAPEREAEPEDPVVPPEPVPPLPDEPAPPEPGTPPADGTASLQVRVVAADDGSPLPGTPFIVYREEELLHRGETDGSGVGAAGDLSPGEAIVRTKADGFVRSVEHKVELVAGRKAELEIALSRGLTLTGFVRDARDDGPISGAKVVITPGGNRRGYFEMTWEPSFGEAACDPNGRFGIDGVPAGRLLTVTATAEGYTDGTLALVLPKGREEPTPIELRLPPCGTVRGVVRDPAGKTVAGATVYAIPASAPDLLLSDPRRTLTGTNGTFVSLTAKSGADGRYEVAGLATGGLYVLRATMDGFADSADHPDVRTTLESLVANVDLSLRPPGVILVRVKTPDGKPATDVKGLILPGGSPFDLTSPDAEGVFRIEGLPPGVGSIRITSERHPLVRIDIEMRPAETNEYEITLEPGIVLAGVVRDDLGRPVPWAKVEAMRPMGPKHRDLSRSEGQAKTDEQGRFRIENLRPGPHALLHYPPKMEGLDLGPVEAPNEEVELRALRFASFKVRFALPSGTAAPESLYLKKSSRPQNEGVWGSSGKGWSGHGIAWNNGEVEYEGVSACPTEIWLTIPGHAPVYFELDPKPGEVVDLGVVQLDAGVTLNGRVVDPDGAPVGGVEIGFERGPVDFDAVVSRGDGTFRLEHLPKGEADVTSFAEGYLDGRLRVNVGDGAANLVLRLLRGGYVQGRVVDESGKPVTGLDLHLYDPKDKNGENRFGYTSTDVRGEFGGRLLAGRYMVEVWRGQDHLTTVEVTLSEGAETPLEIVLAK